jgi:hypothetical protein
LWISKANLVSRGTPSTYKNESEELSLIAFDPEQSSLSDHRSAQKGMFHHAIVSPEILKQLIGFRQCPENRKTSPAPAVDLLAFANIIL